MAIVALRDVVEALETAYEEADAYLDPGTGKIVNVTHEERRMIDDDVPDEEWPPWQREYVPKMREALESPSFLRLPGTYDIHDWDIMSRFTEVQADHHREQLRDAIHGRGAFSHFRSTIHRLGLQKAWERHYAAALEEIARKWLEEHEIAYR